VEVLLVVMVVVVVVVVIISKFVVTQRNISCITGCHPAARLNPNSSNTRIHDW
jgi:competence protein ComGC